jgi:hypothetical protein
MDEKTLHSRRRLLINAINRVRIPFLVFVLYLRKICLFKLGSSTLEMREKSFRKLFPGAEEERRGLKSVNSD